MGMICHHEDKVGRTLPDFVTAVLSNEAAAQGHTGPWAEGLSWETPGRYSTTARELLRLKEKGQTVLEQMGTQIKINVSYRINSTQTTILNVKLNQNS